MTSASIHVFASNAGSLSESFHLFLPMGISDWSPTVSVHRSTFPFRPTGPSDTPPTAFRLSNRRFLLVMGRTCIRAKMHVPRFCLICCSVPTKTRKQFFSELLILSNHFSVGQTVHDSNIELPIPGSHGCCKMLYGSVSVYAEDSILHKKNKAKKSELLIFAN